MNYGVAYLAQLQSKSRTLYEELDRSIVSLAEVMLADNSAQDLKNSYQLQLGQASVIKDDDISSYVSNKLIGSNITGVLVTNTYLDMNGGMLVIVVAPLTK